MNSFTLRMKFSSGCKYSFRLDCLTICSNCRFLILRTSRAGNRSLIRLVKIGISSVTILCKLKSLKTHISTWKRRVNNISQDSVFIQRQNTINVFYPNLRSILAFLFQGSCNYQNWLDSMKSPVITALQKLHWKGVSTF